MNIVQNIKNILLSQIKNEEKQQKYYHEWEDRHYFFFQHKTADKENHADASVKEFLTWFLQIELQKDFVSITHKYFQEIYIQFELNANFHEVRYCDILDKIEKYFSALKYLVEHIEAIKEDKNFEHIDFKSLVSGRKITNHEKVALYPILIYLLNPSYFEYKQENKKYQIKKENINHQELCKYIIFFNDIAKNSQAVQENIRLAKEFFEEK